MSVTKFPTRSCYGIVHELDPMLYRREGTIKAGSGALSALTVLGKITAEDKYVPVDFAAVDGSQNAAAISMAAVDATSADKQLVILTGHAQIIPNQLKWPTGTTAAQQATGLAALETRGIVSHQR
ncbi:MAG: head decoration protein [Hyphomicrobiaceae bacterium]|nr:head decoration protein [Hyphomicrobiaceae bacterium]